MAITITAHNGALAVKTPYSAEFVSQLKRVIPQADRSFTGKPDNAWIVDAKHGQAVQKLIYGIWGQYVKLPPMIAAEKLVNHQLWCEYIGQCKQRGDGTVSAYGNDGKGWNIVLPEKVLMSYFGEWVEEQVDAPQPQSKPKPTTLYQKLVVASSADAGAIKKAYLRMARQWHPDACSEQNAHEMFIAIKAAYDVLSDPMKRKRYDAGLALEATLKPAGGYKPYWMDDGDNLLSVPAIAMIQTPYGYRSPLRCGVLTVDAEMKAGRIVVQMIHDWQDIVKDSLVMVSSWPSSGDTYQIAWV